MRISIWTFCNSPDSKVHGANMGPSGADRTQVGPKLAPWTLLWLTVSGSMPSHTWHMVMGDVWYVIYWFQWGTWITEMAFAVCTITNSYTQQVRPFTQFNLKFRTIIKVICTSLRRKSTAPRLFVYQMVQEHRKNPSKAPYFWPFGMDAWMLKAFPYMDSIMDNDIIMDNATQLLNDSLHLLLQIGESWVFMVPVYFAPKLSHIHRGISNYFKDELPVETFSMPYLSTARNQHRKLSRGLCCLT